MKSAAPELLGSGPLSTVTVSCSVAASAERAAKFAVIVPPLSSQLALNDRPSMSRTVWGFGVPLAGAE